MDERATLDFNIKTYFGNQFHSVHGKFAGCEGLRSQQTDPVRRMASSSIGYHTKRE
jgi:hypothetical protein